MLSFRKIKYFGLHTLLLFLGFLGLFAFSGSYAFIEHGCSILGNQFFDRIGANYQVHFFYEKGAPIVVQMTHPSLVDYQGIGHVTKSLFYPKIYWIAYLFLLALVLASPISRQRKLRNTLLSALIFSAFTSFLLYIRLLHQSTELGFYKTAFFDTISYKSIYFLDKMIGTNVAFLILFSFLLWVVLSFRKDDFVPTI